MDRFPQERNPRQTASQVVTPGLIGPWNPPPVNVDEALEQLIARPHEVVLAHLGPDVTGGGFGDASWVPGNWIGTNSIASFTAIAMPDQAGGYVAQTDEEIVQISITAPNGPTAASTVWIWVRPAGGVFADIAHAIPIALGAKETFHTTPLTLNQGDAVAFYLDAGDPIWSVFGSGIIIKGRRREL